MTIIIEYPLKKPIVYDYDDEYGKFVQFHSNKQTKRWSMTT